MENTRFTDLFEVLLEGMFETILASQHLSFSCTFRLFKSRVERRLYSLKPISMMQFHKCEMFIIFVEIMSKRCSALSMLKDHRLMSETVSLWPLNSNVYGVVLWLLPNPVFAIFNFFPSTRMFSVKGFPTFLPYQITRMFSVRCLCDTLKVCNS
jgi:hypothetical protein